MNSKLQRSKKRQSPIAEAFAEATLSSAALAIERADRAKARAEQAEAKAMALRKNAVDAEKQVIREAQKVHTLIKRGELT